jgi:hypothetical protein
MKNVVWQNYWTCWDSVIYNHTKYRFVTLVIQSYSYAVIQLYCHYFLTHLCLVHFYMVSDKECFKISKTIKRLHGYIVQCKEGSLGKSCNYRKLVLLNIRNEGRQVWQI